MNDPLLAYSLSHAETGWQWRLYDRLGELVASGMDETQAAAEQALNVIMDRFSQDGEPQGAEAGL
jgi:hypothetical protein